MIYIFIFIHIYIEREIFMHIFICTAHTHLQVLCELPTVSPPPHPANSPSPDLLSGMPWSAVSLSDICVS